MKDGTATGMINIAILGDRLYIAKLLLIVLASIYCGAFDADNTLSWFNSHSSLPSI